MTVREGGWICSGCWTPNRAKDVRCLGCRVQRGAAAPPPPAMDKSRSRAERKEDDDLAIPTVLAVLVMCTVPLLLLDAGLRFFSGIDAVTTLVDDGPGMIARAGARSIWWGVAEVGAAVAVLRGSRRAWFFGMSVAGVTVASQLALPSLIGAPLANAFRPPWWPAYVAGHAFIVVVLLAAFLSEGVIRTRARLSRT